VPVGELQAVVMLLSELGRIHLDGPLGVPAAKTANALRLHVPDEAIGAPDVGGSRPARSAPVDLCQRT
jgi:hypothetical protein